MRSHIPDKITESWVILWFPPRADRRRAFRSESEALKWLKSSEEATKWNPILTSEVVEVFRDETIIPIPPEYLWREDSE